MYKIIKDSLIYGDIILIKSDSRLSRKIRDKSNSEFSHAMLYMGNSSYIDSDGGGVQANNIERLVFEQLEDVAVLRLIDNREKLPQIESFARSKIGTEYSLREAIGASDENKAFEAMEPNRQFCTRFVTQAYNSAGINLVDNYNYPIPDDILNSKLLMRLEDIVREAYQAEIEFARSESPLKKQTDIHNSIFKEARRISKLDIQTFDQLYDLVIKHPEYDEELTEVVGKSGYLYMMENDLKENPWHYDSKLFLKHYDTYASRIYAISEIEKIEIPINRSISSSIQGMKTLILEYNRKFFKQELELRKKIKSFSDKRLKTIQEVSSTIGI